MNLLKLCYKKKESTETKRQLNYWDLSSTGYKLVNVSKRRKLDSCYLQNNARKIHLVKHMHIQDVDTKEEDICNI